jgi:hypothetical protein
VNKPNILFLADTAHQAGAVLDHIDAVTASTEFSWHVLNPLVFKTIDKLDFTHFDAIGVHFSIKLHGHYYLSSSLKKKINAYQGTKFIFLQDEYQKVNQTQDALYRLGFDILFTLVSPELFDEAYPDPRLKYLKKVHVLTGYVGEHLMSIVAPPVSERDIDVSYRSRRCEYRLGKLAQDKTNLASEFVSRTGHTNLKFDISIEESDRVYGKAWFDLLMRSKVVLGTESGASIWDADGLVAKKVKQFLRKHKGADFNRVFHEVLEPYDGKLMYSAISPRVFEAAATKTPMVMFPGYYNGICKPGVHYIVLEKDCSNLSDVLNKIKDDAYLQAMADRTYVDLIESGQYAQHKLSRLVEHELLLMFKKKPCVAYVHDLLAQIGSKLHRYRFLNKLRCAYTELGFIGLNFLRLLLIAPSEISQSRVKSLSEGAKQYFAYLNPRMKT